MNKLLLLTSLVLMFIFVSCSSNSEEDLTGSGDPPDLNVSYSNAVKAIIDGNCLSCHSNPTQNSAPMSLTTYTEVRQAVTSRGLIGQIESGTMPKDGEKLSAVNIKKIKDWRAGGYKE